MKPLMADFKTRSFNRENKVTMIHLCMKDGWLLLAIFVWNINFLSLAIEKKAQKADQTYQLRKLV